MITISHLLFAAALLELVMTSMMARRLVHASSGVAPERQRTVYMMCIGAGVVAAVALVLLGLFLPNAQTPIF